MEYIAAILLSLLYVHVSCQDNVDVINAFRQACPYTNFCLRNASQAIQNGHQAPCCRDCSCADDCWKRDNCCPDKIVKEEAVTIEKETCKSHFVLKNENSVFKNIDFGPDKHYFVIETCPETGNDGIVKEKCAGTMAETLTDLIWVSDTKTNKIYNNRFCAECNGVRNYRQWNLATDCFDIMIKENYSLNISSYSEECLSVKPPNRKANENTCLSPTISTCNKTGLWDVEDSVTETLCRSHPLLFVEEARGAIENIYHNIFCFKLNKPQVITVEDVCSSDEILGRWTVSSFTAILDIFGTKDNLVKKRRCAMDEVEDPLKVNHFIM